MYGEVMIPRFVTATFVSMVTAATFASTTPNADIDIPFQKFVLANGLTLIVHEDAKAPIVAVNVWYHVGSKDEKPGKTGFAHLFEHLMFNGSEHFNDDYYKALERVGATDRNGTTNTDRTNYFQNVPKTALDTVLWLESDRMGHLLAAIDQAQARRATGRGAEREAPGRKPALRARLHHAGGELLPAGPPLLVDHHRVDDGSRRRQPRGRARVVSQRLRRRQRHPGRSPATSAPTKCASGSSTTSGTSPPARLWCGATNGSPSAPAPSASRCRTACPRPGSTRAGTSRALGHSRGRPARARRRLAGARQELSALPAAWSTRTRSPATSPASSWRGRSVASSCSRPASSAASTRHASSRRSTRSCARFLDTGPTPGELERVQTSHRAQFVRGMERIGGFGGKSDILAQSEVYGGSPDAYRASLERVASATPEQVVRHRARLAQRR